MADDLGDVYQPSAFECLGALTGMFPGELIDFGERGKGLIAVITYCGQQFRLQLDPVESPERMRDDMILERKAKARQARDGACEHRAVRLVRKPYHHFRCLDCGQETQTAKPLVFYPPVEGEDDGV